MVGCKPRHLKDAHMKINSEFPSEIMKPFSTSAIDLLDLTSQKIFARKIKREELFPIAFYCRKANLLTLKEHYKNRLSCGTVLFICPKNVDVLSCYAVVFGILTGNHIVIRPSKSELFHQFVEILFSATTELGLFGILKSFRILDPLNESDLAFWSQRANVRVAWGGNDSIRRYSAMQKSVDCRDVFFAHRNSLAIIDCDKIDNIREVAKLFWKCTYSFEQASCSSPKIVYFLHPNKSLIVQFWSVIAVIAKQKNNFSPINMIDKYYYLCKYLATQPSKIKMYGNYVYVIEGIRHNLKEGLPLGWGTFITFNARSIAECIQWPEQLQTIAYYGLNREDILDELLKSDNTSITRIVSLDKVLEFNHLIDGIDIIERLTRKIAIY